MEAGTHIRLFGRVVYVSPVAWLMTAIGLAYLGEVLLQGGFTGEGQGLFDLGGVRGDTAWAAGAVAARGVFDRGEWWRLVSGTFLHGSATHLLFNAWALYQLGWLAVRIFGPTRFLVAYLASGYVGALASALWMSWRDGLGMSLGASTSVCGLLGLLFADLRKRPDPQSMLIARQLGMWSLIILVMGIASSFGGGVRLDNAGHAGGFAAGYLLASVLSPRLEAEIRKPHGPSAVHGVLAALLLATILGLGIAFGGAPGRMAWIESVTDFSARVESGIRRLRRDPAALADVRRSIDQATLPDDVAGYGERVRAVLDLPGHNAAVNLGALENTLLELRIVHVFPRAPDLFRRVVVEPR